MRTCQVFVAMALFGASLNAAALNRCTDAAGKVTYTDQPCQTADSKARVKITDSAGFEPERLPRRVVADPRGQSDDLAGTPQRAASPGAAHIGRTQAEIACANAKDDYETLAAKKGAALDRIRASRLAASQQCGVPVAATAAHLLREEQQARQAERQADAELAREQHARPPQPFKVYRCDDRGCQTSIGRIRGDADGKTMYGPQGQVCNRQGNWIRCQ